MTHWNNQAKMWALLGPPLKPSFIDIEKCTTWINEKNLMHKKSLKVLVLGVTPELVNIAWPEDTTLYALDNNISMIESILPTHTKTLKPIPLAGNWLKIPLSSSSIDIVIGDGCYSSLAKNYYGMMSSEIVRTLKSDGILIMRFFMRPEKNESLVDIRNDLMTKRINNFHIFKLRLAMALHESLEQGVCLKQVWDNWDLHFRNTVHESSEWEDLIIRTIDNYKNTDIFYTFPTLKELRKELCRYFSESEIFIPEYQLGERCPTLKFSPIRSTHEANTI